MLAELVRVDALGVREVAAGVADSDVRRPAATAGRGVAADVAEALDDDVGAVEGEALVLAHSVMQWTTPCPVASRRP